MRCHSCGKYGRTGTILNNDEPPTIIVCCQPPDRRPQPIDVHRWLRTRALRVRWLVYAARGKDA